MHLVVTLGRRRVDLPGYGKPSRRQRFFHGFCIAHRAALRGDRYNRTRVQIHRLLRLVGQVRGAMLHLHHFGVRIVRIHPLFIGRLLLALAIHAPHRRLVVRIDTRFRRQLPQILPVALACVATHDGAHRRVGFQRRCIDADGLALQHSTPRYFRQHEGEDRLMRGLIQ